MPRSTRHKSSKHKDAREYSDSEKESSLKERKSKEESSARVSKDSGDKRKLDSKEYYDSVNGEYYEEYTSSKRRKGKTGESGSDRWNGKDEEKGESSKKTKASSEKSRRREEGDGEETKKSSGKSDGKHRESSRRESKEFDKEKDREKDRKYKESKSEKFYDGEDHHKSKVVSEKSESKAQEQLRSPGKENHTEKRSRRKKDDHGAGDKHQDNSDDVGDRLFTSGDDYIKDGKHKGEKSRDKYREDKEEDIKPKGEKQRDERPSKEHHRSDEKLLRDESKKKSKGQDSDHGHEPDSEHDGYHDRERKRDYERESDRNERDRERARDRDYERDRDRDRDRERERDRDRRDYEHDRYHERDWDRDRSRDRDRDHDRDRTHDREKDRSRDYYHDGKRSKSDRERDSDRDMSRLDDQSGRYKDRREGRKSPDYQDYQEVITSTRGSRAEPDGDIIRSDRQPSSSVVQEENGNGSDQVAKGVSSREAAELSGGSERGTRHKGFERTAKMEDGVIGEFQGEKSSATKASPRTMVERSPSSTSFDRRFNNRSGEAGHRNSARDYSAAEDERLLVDETSQAELSFNNKPNQNNSSFPPRPESRSGIGSPRVGPREEDNRVNTGGRYKRGVDAMMGRGQQGNVWRGVPSWPSPLPPNGFIPFQHVPTHGGFQTMMPQFPSPSLFGVRPSMEMNHQGIPYHMPDAERFSSHMRPLGWQNMMDASGASHMHGFFGDMSNSVFRDESNMYGGPDWDHNRRMHSRVWESGADEWKNRNGDASLEVSSMSGKDDNLVQVADDESLGGQTSHSENNRAKSVEAGSNLTSPAKELLASSPKVTAEVVAEDPVPEKVDNTERYRRHYLSKLDISVELADPELRKSISVLMGEERITIDDGTPVFVNLKEGGKRVPKSISTSLTTLSLFPSQNSSVFQIAMDLYKEHRFELNGLPNVEIQGPPQVSPSSLVEVDTSDDVNDAMKGISFMETSDVKIADVSDSDKSHKEQQNVSSPADSGMEIATQDEGSSSPNPNKSPEAPEAVASDHIEGYEQDAKSDDGAGVDQTMETARDHHGVPEGEPVTDQTMETAREHDGVPEGDPVTEETMETAREHAGVSEGDPFTLTVVSPALETMEVDERNDLSQDENMEEAVVKKEAEAEADDGDGDGEGGVVGDVSPKVTETLVHESDESVISRIHHSPQSTH
ncbi:hypothetical protein EUTSA_v10012484mg [Eutrema salsugineum]|uniref:Nipped-B-like protein B n=1 Tax=Eutrema salsugineum TaxID=72664 RepID=V4LHG4_EUTSA|nr:uncharacterized protein LOC18018903 [Eutrema salsugineum]ESQ43159.1 hypothetical protein EUTSA_v10012484mg [Eutrema salsugineum]